MQIAMKTRLAPQVPPPLNPFQQWRRSVGNVDLNTAARLLGKSRRSIGLYEKGCKPPFTTRKLMAAIAAGPAEHKTDPFPIAANISASAKCPGEKQVFTRWVGRGPACQWCGVKTSVYSIGAQGETKDYVYHCHSANCTNTTSSDKNGNPAPEATMDGRALHATGRTEQFNFKAKPELKDRIVAAAADDGIAVSELMERALIEALDKRPKTLTERIIIPMTPKMVEDIEAYWHAARFSSRSEGIRHLIEVGLATEAKRQPK